MYFPFSYIGSIYIYIYVYKYIYIYILSAIEVLGRIYKNIHNSNIQMSDDFALDAVGFMDTIDDD